MKTAQIKTIINTLKDGRRKDAVTMLDPQSLPEQFWTHISLGNFGKACALLIETHPHLDNIADMIWEG